MSRTLSKVLIICALVVVLPLMIAGTAFAAYYAINATVSIEIFVDQEVTGGHAEVSFKDSVGTTSKTLKVTDGHLKKATFKTSSVGYEFVGWYAGTYKAYADALANNKEIKYSIKTPTANVKMTDYQNLVAVFKAKHFQVSYSYLQTPSKLGGTGILVTEAPKAANGLVVDGKSENYVGKTDFVYGEALHTLEFKDHPEFTFDGWYVGEGTTKYTTANFAETGDIVLTGKWIDSPSITLTYLDEDGKTLETISNELYANHEYELKTPDQFDLGELEVGYTYGWQDIATGNVIDKINSDKDVKVKLHKSVIKYTAKLEYDKKELTHDETVLDEVSFFVTNKETLTPWTNKANWEGAYSFWHFDHLTYNDEKVEDLNAILTQVIAANPNKTTEVVFKAVKTSDVTTFRVVPSTVNEASETVYKGYVEFKSEDLDGTEGYVDPVWKGDAPMNNRYDFSRDFEAFGNSLYEELYLLGSDDKLATFYNEDVRGDEVPRSQVAPDTVTVQLKETGGVSFKLKITAGSTLNDIIERIYERTTKEQLAEILSDGVLTVYKLRVEFK